jgi:hypothetical protein
MDRLIIWNRITARSTSCNWWTLGSDMRRDTVASIPEIWADVGMAMQLIPHWNFPFPTS